MPDPLETPDLQTLLCFNVYATGHSFNRFYQPILEPLGITYPQFLVLLTLLREDGRSVGEIGETLMLDTNTLSPLLKRMEVQGACCRAAGWRMTRRGARCPRAQRRSRTASPNA